MIGGDSNICGYNPAGVPASSSLASLGHLWHFTLIPVGMTCRATSLSPGGGLTLDSLFSYLFRLPGQHRHQAAAASFVQATKVQVLKVSVGQGAYSHIWPSDSLLDVWMMTKRYPQLILASQTHKVEVVWSLRDISGKINRWSPDQIAFYISNKCYLELGFPRQDLRCFWKCTLVYLSFLYFVW